MIRSVIRVKTLNQEEYIAARSFPNIAPVKLSTPSNPDPKGALDPLPLPQYAQGLDETYEIVDEPVAMAYAGEPDFPYVEVQRGYEDPRMSPPRQTRPYAYEPAVYPEVTYADDYDRYYVGEPEPRITRRTNMNPQSRLRDDLDGVYSEERDALIDHYEKAIDKLKDEIRSNQDPYAKPPISRYTTNKREPEVGRGRDDLRGKEAEIARLRDELAKMQNGGDQQVAELKRALEAAQKNNSPESEDIIRRLNLALAQERENALRAEDELKKTNEDSMQQKIRLVLLSLEYERLGKMMPIMAGVHEEQLNKLKNPDRNQMAELDTLRRQLADINAVRNEKDRKFREMNAPALAELERLKRQVADQDEAIRQVIGDNDKLRKDLGGIDQDYNTLMAKQQQIDKSINEELDRIRYEKESVLKDIRDKERRRFRQEFEIWLQKAKRAEEEHIGTVKQLRQELGAGSRMNTEQQQQPEMMNSYTIRKPI